MGNLKYAILGLLNQQSRTGYELAKQFEMSLSEFWSAKHSQIYPELKSLHEAGMVEYTIEITGTVLEKKLYTITEAGKKDFLQWLEKPHTLPAMPKDEFRLQLFFSNCLSPASRINLLQNRLQQHRKRLLHLEKNRDVYSVVPAVQTPEFSDYMVLLGAVMREETTCAWLEQCLALCEGQGPKGNP